MMWWRKQPTEPATTPAEALDEQLSAFIDGDLSAADAAAIEARVAAEPEVLDALDGMQLIRDSLVLLGEARAPHAFTLEAPPGRAGLPRMELFARLGAAASASALTAVLVGDVVTTAEPDVQSSATLAQPATMQAFAPTAPASPDERTTSEAAVKDARERAEQLADLAGTSLGAVRSISESNNRGFGGRVEFAVPQAASFDGFDTATALNPGEQEISLTVFLVYDVN